MMKEVTVLGKKYPFEITMGALIDLKRDYGKEVSEIGTDIEGLMRFFYCCIRSASRKAGLKFNVDFVAFADSLSVDDFTALQQSVDEGEAKKK
jgi:hypothetical protein